jgi:hypothetical protein
MELERGNEKQEKMEDLQRKKKKLGGFRTMPFILGIYIYIYIYMCVCVCVRFSIFLGPRKNMQSWSWPAIISLLFDYRK